MPITKLDPKTALVVIDIQEGIVGPAADPARDILIHKRQWGAFYGTDLESRYGLAALRGCGARGGGARRQRLELGDAAF
jgi:nicotinamidase-related amidase